MINFDNLIEENIKENKPNWPEIPDHPYRILIITGSGSGKKIHSLIQQISHQILIKCIYMLKIHTKQNISFQKSADSKHLNHSKAFIEHSNNIDNIQKNIEEYNPNKKRKK